MSARHCVVLLHIGKALDSSGWPAPAAEVCERCAGCESYSADMGLATADIALKASDSGQSLSLAWNCPECGVAVSERTTPLESIEQARVVENDPLCWRCRKEHNTRPFSNGIGVSR